MCPGFTAAINGQSISLQPIKCKQKSFGWICKEAALVLPVLRRHSGPRDLVALHVTHTCTGMPAAAASLRRVRPCAAPQTAAPQAPRPWTLQAGTLQWAAIPSPVRESEKRKWSRSVVSDCSRPMDCSPPGSSVHGTFQARVLEWAATAFSTGMCKHTLSLMNTKMFSIF